MILILAKIYLVYLFILFVAMVYNIVTTPEHDENMTENKIMQLCQYDILMGRDTHSLDVLDYIDNYKMNKGRELDYNFSFDNWALVASWIKEFEGSMSDVPLLGRHTWRPDNFIFFLWAKYPAIAAPALPFLSLSMIVSMLRVWRKDKHGNRYIDTDGKLINYYRTEAFSMPVTRAILDFIISNDKDLRSWEFIHDIYFSEEAGNIFVYQAYKLNRSYDGKRIRVPDNH